ncbi:MAG: type II secretion system protein [Cyanothece sp. SIO1E1]|nr:type II secretion system protein [Cyanothece sp. SIO1E1]
MFINFESKFFRTVLRRSSQGYTLPELLVSFLALGIMGTIGSLQWTVFLEAHNIKMAQDQAYRAMREAQISSRRDKVKWRVSFREYNNVAQWIIHQSQITPTPGNWHDFHPSVQIDPETTLLRKSGVYRAEFDYKGNANGRLGRITFSGRDHGKNKRCVFMSTFIGSLRKAEENSKPDRNGRYCY